MFFGLFSGSSAHAAQLRSAAAMRSRRYEAAIKVHNQKMAGKGGNQYLMGLGVPDRPEATPEGMDAVQALAYDAERYPHFIELDGHAQV